MGEIQIQIAIPFQESPSHINSFTLIAINCAIIFTAHEIRNPSRNKAEFSSNSPSDLTIANTLQPRPTSYDLKIDLRRLYWYRVETRTF